VQWQRCAYPVLLTVADDVRKIVRADLITALIVNV
jgi:hypothetical protein